MGVGSAKLFKRLGNERVTDKWSGLKIFLNQSGDGISPFVFQHLTVGGRLKWPRLHNGTKTKIQLIFKMCQILY